MTRSLLPLLDEYLRIKNVPEERRRAVRHLAYHAALPVALTTELVHLIRVNFFLERSIPALVRSRPVEPLPYAAEADLLFSPICQEKGEGLYSIDAETRNLLLKRLNDHYGAERIKKVAALLWQYTERSAPWAERPVLDRAQRLTVLNFLDPAQADQWFQASHDQLRAVGDEPPEWFVAARRQLNQDNESMHEPEPANAGPPIQDDRPFGSEQMPRRKYAVRPVDGFVGREKEISVLIRALHERKSCLITGEAGMGKTKLAQEVAYHTRTIFPDGAVYTSVAFSGSSESVKVNILLELFVELRSLLHIEPTIYSSVNSWKLLTLLERELRGRKVLIVLDGIDLINYWPELSAGIASTCGLLATSRVPMRGFDVTINLGSFSHSEGNPRQPDTTMPDNLAPGEEIHQISSLLAVQQRNLRHLTLQEALYGPFSVPPHIIIEIREQQKIIAELEALLRKHGVDPTTVSDKNILFSSAKIDDPSVPNTVEMPDDADGLMRYLAARQHDLRMLQWKAANYGIDIPLSLFNMTEDTKRAIAAATERLNTLGIDSSIHNEDSTLNNQDQTDTEQDDNTLEDRWQILQRTLHTLQYERATYVPSEQPLWLINQIDETEQLLRRTEYILNQRGIWPAPSDERDASAAASPQSSQHDGLLESIDAQREILGELELVAAKYGPSYVPLAYINNSRETCTTIARLVNDARSRQLPLPAELSAVPVESEYESYAYISTKTLGLIRSQVLSNLEQLQTQQSIYRTIEAPMYIIKSIAETETQLVALDAEFARRETSSTAQTRQEKSTFTPTDIFSDEDLINRISNTRDRLGMLELQAAPFAGIDAPIYLLYDISTKRREVRELVVLASDRSIDLPPTMSNISEDFLNLTELEQILTYYRQVLEIRENQVMGFGVTDAPLHIMNHIRDIRRKIDDILTDIAMLNGA